MTIEEKEKALYALKKSTPIMAVTHNEFDDYIKTLNKIADWLEQSSCSDTISRQQAIDKMQELEDEDIKAYGCSIPEGFDGKRAIEALKSLPSSIHPKAGHWINGDPICPCCGEDKFKDLVADIWSDWQPKYCPNCGAKMLPEPYKSESEEI